MSAAFRRLACRWCLAVYKLKRIMGTVTGVALTYGVYKTLLGNQVPDYVMRAKSETTPTIPKPPFSNIQPPASKSPPEAQPPAPSYAKSQPSVTSHDKAHALFLRIRVNYGSDMQKVAAAAAKLQQYVDEVESSAISSCGNSHIFAGVGFGPEFYRQLKGSLPSSSSSSQQQHFTNEKHDLLSGDGAGGDILIHAKSNTPWMLQELARQVLLNMPEGSVQRHEETLGQHKDAEVVARRQSPKDGLGILNYQYSRGEVELLPPPKGAYRAGQQQLMFVQETGSEDTETKRREAAVDPATGGSFVMTQRWVHDVTTGALDSQGREVLHDWVDKAWKQCASTGYEGEKRFKPPTELGAELATQSTDRWMGKAYKDCLAMQKKLSSKTKVVCSTGNFSPPAVTRLVRQSVPYHHRGEFGLFFISYCRWPRLHLLLLDRLLASTNAEDHLNAECSQVFNMSHNVHSAVWYFPGVEELKDLLK